MEGMKYTRKSVLVEWNQSKSENKKQLVFTLFVIFETFYVLDGLSLNPIPQRFLNNAFLSVSSMEISVQLR